MFSVELLPEKVMKIIQIIEGLKNKAHITQSGGCFFSATSARKSFEAQWNQGSTKSPIQLFIAGWNCYWTICVSLTFYNVVFWRTFVGGGFYSSWRLITQVVVKWLYILKFYPHLSWFLEYLLWDMESLLSLAAEWMCYHQNYLPSYIWGPQKDNNPVKHP